MSIYHVSGGGSSGPSDRMPFVGYKMPDEIKPLGKALQQIDKQTFRKLLQVIVQGLEGKPVTYQEYTALASEKTSEDDSTLLFSGLYKLLQLALRVPKATLKQEHFKQDLAELRIPEDFIDDLASVLFGNRRQAIDDAATKSNPSLPKLQSFNWRTDVVISTSVLNRVLEPSVAMEMTLSDGNIHQFEVSLQEFHKLRYNVAQVLKEMEDLEKRSILKIQD